MNSSTGPKPKLLDGGLGTFLLKKLSGLTCTDTLNHSDPQAVINAHTAFLTAGARYLTTNTFCCDPLSLKNSDYGIKATSQRGAELAIAARTVFGDPGIKVMGSLGPGWLSPEKGEVSLRVLIDTYALRAEGLSMGGVDIFLIETVQDLQQAEAACLGIEKALGADLAHRPIFISASVSQQGQRIGQHALTPALKTLKALRPAGLGFNCGEGPEGLENALSALSGFQGSILLKPNAGTPDKLRTPAAFAQTLEAYFRAPELPRITHWGGCCGAAPAHLKALHALTV